MFVCYKCGEEFDVFGGGVCRQSGRPMPICSACIKKRFSTNKSDSRTSRDIKTNDVKLRENEENTRSNIETRENNNPKRYNPRPLIQGRDKSAPPEPGIPIRLSSSMLFPRTLIARSKYQGYQTRFFESANVPSCLIESNIQDDEQRLFAQHRIDYPASKHNKAWTEREQQVLSVAGKILTRGRISLCSPYLEDALQYYFLNKDSNVESITSIADLPYPQVNRSRSDLWFDSMAEKSFYDHFLFNILGENISRWVLPQVEIASLLPSNVKTTISGRVDFLIYHPQAKPIVVEIDGKQHEKHTSADKDRDAILSNNGYVVIRIPVVELDRQDGSNLRVLTNLLTPLNVKQEHSLTDYQKYILSVKYAHQIQLCLLEAIQSGYLSFEKPVTWHLTTDLNRLDCYGDNDASFIMQCAVGDFLQLFSNLYELYSLTINDIKAHVSLDLDNSLSPKYSIHISFAEVKSSSYPTFCVQDIHVPFHIANSVIAAGLSILDKPKEENLRFFLKYIFRKQDFREGQYDAVSRTMEGKDSIVLLPTGAGKSIIYQLASLLLPGRTIVIEPIISLMNDQIDNMKTIGIDRCIAITSQIDDASERLQALSLFGQGEYLIAYIAPERFQTIEFRQSLRALTKHSPIAVIAVDEAHCVSEWGHDFRTAYLNIGRISRQYCQSNGIIPPLIALTGTASRSVLKDVQRELQIEYYDAIITPKSFDRPELIFSAISCTSEEKGSHLIEYLSQILPNKYSTPPETFFRPNGERTYSGLVFCPHVNGAFGVVEQCDKIKSALGITVSFYSGKEPKHWSLLNWGKTKNLTATQFKHNKIPLLVCTKAFGMGIDKPNIRYTVHYGIPSSIESFYQEAGRAGRDRGLSHCCIIVSNDNPERNLMLLSPSTSPDELANVIKNKRRDEDDDVTRALFFQANAFPGITREKEKVSRVIKQLGDLSANSVRAITFQSLNRAEAEKALHRLLVLGVIRDYTIKYSAEEFTVEIAGADKNKMVNSYFKYVAGYLAARAEEEIKKAQILMDLPCDRFVLEMAGLLLNFIYEIIERGRRRALSEMLQTATVDPTDEGIRNRILRYFEVTQYSENIENILSSADAGIDDTVKTFETIRSPNEASELRGQVSRYLESYPDHPGLLMLRALSETYSRDSQDDVVKDNFIASFSSSVKNYGVRGHALNAFMAWGIRKISERNATVAQELQTELLSSTADRYLARTFVSLGSPELRILPAAFLLDRLINRANKVCRTGDCDEPGR